MYSGSEFQMEEAAAGKARQQGVAYAHCLCLFHINLHTELSGDLIQVIH